MLSYFTHLDLSAAGTGEYNARHLYIIKFRIGVTYKQLLEDIQREPFVRSVFTEIIFESHIAEIDGKLAMLLFIDGASDIDIVQTVQEKLIPSLRAQPRRGLDRGGLDHARALARCARCGTTSCR